MPTSPTLRAQRCAIYTRKSVEDAWDVEFNSIESQRDICSAYIACQQHRHWVRLPQSYDDAGLSGATLHRPALQRLLRDIERGEVDIVLIYKIDRLTRSLADFIRVIDVLDRYKVKFVSVTQSFDTSDSMGRLLLNILLTFAQFERELIADRIRDKVAAIKRRGRINGGRAPFGYDIVDGHLLVNPGEAEQVRAIFQRYLELGSCSALTREIKARGIRAKVFVTRAGVVRGGGPASNGMLYHILKNPIYVGRVPHNGDSYPGEHEAIVDDAVWEAAKAQIAHRRKFGPVPRQPRNILKRLFRDSHGRRLVIVTSGKKHQHRYYESAKVPWAEQQGLKRFRIRADRLEELVVAAVKGTLEDREKIRAALRDIGRRGEELDYLARRSSAACENLQAASIESLREMMRSLIVEGEISSTNLILVFRSSEVARFLAWDGIGLYEGDRAAWTAAEPVFTVQRSLADVAIGQMDVLAATIATQSHTPTQPALVTLIRKARHAQAAFDAERDAGITELAKRLRCSPRRFSRLVRLNYLAPDIVAAIFSGSQPPSLTFESLVHGPLPLDWDLQRRIFGFPSRAH